MIWNIYRKFQLRGDIICYRSLSILAHEVIGHVDAKYSAVFLHGILGSKRNWRTPAKQLVKHNPQYKCILVDLRGHGESISLSNQSHTLRDCAQDLSDLVGHLNIHPTIISGHSKISYFFN